MSDAPSIQDCIDGHPLLGRLEDDLRALLLEGVSLRTLVPGEAITREGSTATRWYLMREGGARLSRTRPDGGQEVLGYLGPGVMFGALGICDGAPRAATVAATGPASCVEFPVVLLEGAPRSPEGRLALALREVLALSMNQQLRAANRRLYTVGRRIVGEATEELDGVRKEGGWVLPE